MSNLKNNVAYIIKSITDIRGSTPGKKTLQKMVFLIQQKGVKLNYEYGLHFYGPYCAELDNETSALSSDGIIQFDYSGYSHQMAIKDGYIVEPLLSQEQTNTVNEVINRFIKYSPSELELLTTAIYVYDNIGNKSIKNIIEGVKKIKGQKYSETQINNIIDDFSFFNKFPVN